MYLPSRSEFKKIAQEGLIVPLAKIVPLVDPSIEYFEKIKQEKFSFFLESARFHPKTGRFSFMGFNPFMIFKSKDYAIELVREGRKEFYETNPIDKLRDLFSRLKSAKIKGLPNFTGGAVGYFSYDVGRLFEKLPQTALDYPGLPDIYFAFYDTIVALDHLENKAFIITNVFCQSDLDKAYDEAREKIEGLCQMMPLDFARGRQDTPRLCSGTSLASVPSASARGGAGRI